MNKREREWVNEYNSELTWWGGAVPSEDGECMPELWV